MFGQEILDATPWVAVGVAGIAGVLSFLSPCVLPIVPPYLAYMGGISVGDLDGTGSPRRKALTAACSFVAGLSVVFVMLGLAASALGRIVLSVQTGFNVVAGIIVLLFGFHFLGVIRIPLIQREARIDAGDRGGSAVGAFVLGLAFAFGWTPCIGPILGAILALAAQDGSGGYGMTLMAAYAAGLGLPFILVAGFIQGSLSLMTRLRKHVRHVEMAVGGLLVLVGVLLLTGAFSDLSFWLLEAFPILGTIG